MEEEIRAICAKDFLPPTASVEEARTAPCRYS
jgi:hypothetical protein